MKRFLLSVVLATTLAFTSCETNDLGVWKELNAHSESIKDLYERVSALEELCKQMNDNISSLQAIIQALDTGVYITNVTPVTSGGETVGYAITFSDGESITINHGKDGKDGDGANDGNTPQIGVAKDTDGIYYWTIDGEWILDSNGKKVKAVGTDGQDGKDGITPRLKIENDYWYVSYDEGKTWTQLGKATGEDGQNGADGSNGSNGSNGDSLFKSVRQDEDNVYFTLSDGTVITVPKFNKGDIEKLLERIQSVSYVPNYSDGKATVEYNNSIRRVTLDFEVSPKDAITELANVWHEAISVKAVYTKSRAVSFIDMPIIEFDANATNGIISVTASGENLSQEFFAGSQEASVRLAISDGNSSVTSEYISLVATEIMSYNEIWYTNGSTTTPTTPDRTDVFGTIIVSNTYDSAKECWVLKFDSDVTSIGHHAFFSCDRLTSITIPNRVTSIGDYAFDNCTLLTSITIPNSVTSIGGHAFYDCTSLTNVTIPDSVTSIGISAFAYCDSLTSVTIPDSVTSIGVCAFRGCSSLTSFYGKFASEDNRCLVVDGVLNSFAPAGLTEYTIPNSITEIGGSAFSGCTSLTSVTIPNSVTSIGSYAFAWCDSLTSITIPDNVTSIGLHAFLDCFSLTSVTIGNSVTSIGQSAFLGCSSLTSFYGKFASEDNHCLVVDGVLNSFAPAGLTEYTIPNSITEIGGSAFSGCTSLASVTIPNSVTSIGERTFYECSSLTSVTIGNSVTSIGYEAFSDCTSLKEVYCKPTTPPTGDSDMFDSNASGRTIYVPRNSVSAYKSAQYWSGYASSIVGMDNAEDNPCEIGVVATKFSQAYPSYSAQYPDHTALAYYAYGTGIKSAKYLVAKTAIFESMAAQGIDTITLVNEYGDDISAANLDKVNSENGWIYNAINLAASTSYTVAVYATNEYGKSALATTTHTTDAAPAHTGEPVIGQYYMSCTVETQSETHLCENIFTVESNGNDGVNFLVSSLGVNDNGQHKFYAVYDATASTLTIDGTYYGKESYGPLFGKTLYGHSSDYYYTIFSYNSAESEGKDPIVFGVDPTTKQISSLQTAEFEVAAFTYDGDSYSYAGWFATFQGPGTTIVPYTATASKQSVKAENFVPYRNATAVRAPKANIKSKIEACKSINITSKSMVCTKSIRL